MRVTGRRRSRDGGMRGLACVLAWTGLLAFGPADAAHARDPVTPPDQPVKLVFVHHSSGENWLSDEDGGLGLALAHNRYYVSDTNYGWGPDGIGDRTDIPNWPEWFSGPRSDRYLAALYAESGQRSSYTRTFPDPGGENEIVMFKSCFPNSNLQGRPGDPPIRSADDLSVGNAKAVYLELLSYFASRPDKLFVAITAPPLQDPEFAANARAFNRWLVEDWLSGYDGSNVGVWDFYNVLTDPDNHHRVRGGEVEYVTERGRDTLYYPSNGDDHPSPAGNRKATDEFVPVLNLYYHRWQAGRSGAPAGPPAPTASEVSAARDAGLQDTGLLVDDFEGGGPDWVVFFDGHSQTELHCGPEGGAAQHGTRSLLIEYSVSADGWASCSLVYPNPRDWSAGPGLALGLAAPSAGQPVIVTVYGGVSSEAPLHYESRQETTAEAVDGWQPVFVPWDRFVPVSWEGDGSARFDPGQARGVSFSFDPGSSGWLRVDDIAVAQTASGPPSTQTPATSLPASGDPTPTPKEPGDGAGGGLCPGSSALSLLLAATVAVPSWMRRRAPALARRPRSLP